MRIHIKKTPWLALLLALTLLFTGCGTADIGDLAARDLTPMESMDITGGQSADGTDPGSDAPDTSDSDDGQGNASPSNGGTQGGSNSQSGGGSSGSSGGSIGGNSGGGNTNKLTVTVVVRCDNALRYGGLSENIRRNLPANGYLFNGTLEIAAGETVASVLQRALASQSIRISGGYITSVLGLAEFSCGDESGWLYRVNGTQPGKGVGGYNLQGGERVELLYSVVKGDISNY